MHDDAYLPNPLTITLIRRDAEAGDDWSGRPFRFEATSPQFPGLVGSDTMSEDAVAELINAILNRQSLSPDVVEALLGAGYSQELVQAWDESVWGRDRRYRYDADAAVSILGEYTAGGMPALTACEYFVIGIEPTAAARAHAAGGTPQEARAYIDEAETHKWWRWDFDPDPWVVSGFPYERGRLYAYTCSVEQAVEWEAVVNEHGISDDDLRDILRAGFMPADAAERAASDAAGGSSLADAARRQLALAKAAWGVQP